MSHLPSLYKTVSAYVQRIVQSYGNSPCDPLLDAPKFLKHWRWEGVTVMCLNVTGEALPITFLVLLVSAIPSEVHDAALWAGYLSQGQYRGSDPLVFSKLQLDVNRTLVTLLLAEAPSNSALHCNLNLNVKLHQVEPFVHLASLIHICRMKCSLPQCFYTWYIQSSHRQLCPVAHISGLRPDGKRLEDADMALHRAVGECRSWSSALVEPSKPSERQWPTCQLRLQRPGLD